MAAWIVVGLLGGGAAGFWAGWWTNERGRRMEDRLRSLVPHPQPGDKELLERVLERLLGAVVPEPEKRPVDPHAEMEGWVASEYEPPDDPVGDWTDPFIGLERPLIARLAPGQQIPGVDVNGGDASAVDQWRESGAASFDEWARDSMVPDGVTEDGGSWVDPIRLDSEDGG